MVDSPDRSCIVADGFVDSDDPDGCAGVYIYVVLVGERCATQRD